MAVAPQIVSLWRKPQGTGGHEPADFVCSGILLDQRHVLTVRHALSDAPDEPSVFVRLIDGVATEVHTTLLTRHRELDAAILRLEAAVNLAERPLLLRDANRSFDGRPAVLRVIDPDSYSRAEAASFSVTCYDHDTREYVITPENARGHSGGALEVDGEIIGLLSRRKQDDPLCRAVALPSLWPWIETSLGAGPQVSSSPPPAAPTAGVSPAYLALTERVRERISTLLRESCPPAMTAHWGADPVGEPDLRDRGGWLLGLIEGLIDATGRVLDQSRQPGRDHAAFSANIRACGITLITELVKLAVDGREAPALAKATGPLRLHVACAFPGTADAVYFALEDMPHLLSARQRTPDIASAAAIHHEDLIAGGQGEDLRRELLAKLWLCVMQEEPPARIEAKHERQLRARIGRRERLKRLRYLFTARGPRDWVEESDYRRWADELRIGLVVYEDGECPLLLLDEAELIDSVRDYLQLLEDA